MLYWPSHSDGGRLAQLEERLVYTQEVGSSSLSPPTILPPADPGGRLDLANPRPYMLKVASGRGFAAR